MSVQAMGALESQAPRAWSREAVLSLVIENATQAHEGSHLQGSDGAFALVHCVRDLSVVEAFDEFHDDHLLLIGRELTKRAREQVGVESPGELDGRGRAGHVDGPLGIVERGRGFLRADMVDVGVVCKPIQPRKERTTLPLITPDSLPGFEENLLGEVLSLRVATDPKIQIAVHPFDKTVVKLAKRVRVPCGDDAIHELDDYRVVGALDWV